jgi:VanZ like family
MLGAAPLMRSVGCLKVLEEHMRLLASLVFVVLGILSLRGIRWAYFTFVLLGLLYFPVSVSFRFNPQPCELTPGIQLAIHSLTNYAHIVLFTLFFVMTSAQLRMTNWLAFAWAAIATIGMGVLVEIGQGVTGKGHCRLRDLIPDTAGILIGAIIVLLWNRIRRRPQRAQSVA